MAKNLDLISIDVDSIDYHIWKNLSEFEPRVVVIEYNHSILPWRTVIGSQDGNYVGASLNAIVELGKSNGYELVATTITNAIFIREDIEHPFENVNDIKELYDFKEHGDSVDYAGHTYEGKVFFHRPPTHGAEYSFASSDTVSIQNDDELYFADRPTPAEPLDYFIINPILFLLTHNKTKNMMLPYIEKLVIKPVIKPIYKRLTER
jgi:hypothetical protein